MEDKVHKTFMQSDEYKITASFSSHLSKTNGWDDSRGYDLEYKGKEEVMSSALKSNIITVNLLFLLIIKYAISQSAECA